MPQFLSSIPCLVQQMQPRKTKHLSAVFLTAVPYTSGFMCARVCFRCTHTTWLCVFECFLYTIWAYFALAEFISVKNRHRVPKQYQSWGRGAEGVGRVTAVHIFISVEENDYCNMHFHVSRLCPSGNCMKRSCQMKGQIT